MSTNSFVIVMVEGEETPRSVRYDQFVKQLLKGDTEVMMKLHVGLGVAGEAGELADAIKRECIYGKAPDVDHIIEELGDLRFYMEAVMNLYGLSDQEVLQHNANKLAVRYKSLTYSNEAALGRADKAGE